MFHRSSVLCLLLIALVVMIGALPTGGDGSAGSSVPIQVFSSPVFVALLLWLLSACLACCCRGRVTFRRIGFLLTHFGVVAILVGALWGGVAERKMLVVVGVGEDLLSDRLALSQLEDKLALPFTLSVPWLEPLPEYVFHMPDQAARGGYRMGGRFFPAAEGIDLGEAGVVGMDRLRPDGRHWAPRVILESGAFLQQNRSGGTTCRASIRVEKEGEAPQEVVLGPGESETFFGTRVQIDGLEWRSESEAMVKLRIQAADSERWASVYALPGPQQGSRELPLSHLALPFSLGVTSFRVDHFDPAYALYLPPSAESGEYTYVDNYTPGDEGLTLAADDVVPPARLRTEDGEWVEQVVLADQRMLRRLAAGDKYYEAQVVIRDTVRDGEAVEKRFTMAVNHPVSYRGWRFYLVSYDRQHGQAQYINVTARRDPGRNGVIAGVWMLMAGTFLLCLRRKEGRHVA